MNRAFSLVSVMVFAGLAAAGCEQKGTLRVDKVEPDQGTIGGGDQVTIRGNGFEPGKTQVDVLFGRRRAQSVAISSPTQITVVTPAGEKGPVDVTLTFDNGAHFKIPQGFRYAAPNAGDDVRKAFFSGKSENAPAPPAAPPAAK